MRVLAILVFVFYSFSQASGDSSASSWGNNSPSSSRPTPSECLKYFAAANSRYELAVLDNPQAGDLLTFNRTFDDPEIKERIQEKIEDTFQLMRPFLYDAYENSSQLGSILETRVERAIEAAKATATDMTAANALENQTKNLLDQATKDSQVLTNSKRKIFGLITIGSVASSEEISNAVLNLRRFEEQSKHEVANINQTEISLNRQTKINKAMIVVLFAEKEFLLGLSSRIQNAYRTKNPDIDFILGQIEHKKLSVIQQDLFIKNNLMVIQSATDILIAQRNLLRQMQGQIPFFRTSYAIQFAEAEVIVQKEIADARALQEKLAAEAEQNRRLIAHEEESARLEAEALAQRQQRQEAQRQADIAFSKSIFEKYEPAVSEEIRFFVDSITDNPMGVRLHDFASFSTSLKNRNLTLADYVYLLFRFPRKQEAAEESFAKLWTELTQAYQISAPEFDKINPDVVAGLFMLAQNPTPIRDSELIRFFRLQLKDLHDKSKETAYWNKKANENIDFGTIFKNSYYDLIDKVITTPLKAEAEKKRLQVLAEQQRKEEERTAFGHIFNEKHQPISSIVLELMKNFEDQPAGEAFQTLYNYLLENPQFTLSAHEATYMLLNMPRKTNVSQDLAADKWFTANLLKKADLSYTSSQFEGGKTLLDGEIAVALLSRVHDTKVHSAIRLFLEEEVLDRLEFSFSKHKPDTILLVQFRKLVKQLAQTPFGIQIYKDRVLQEEKLVSEKIQQEKDQLAQEAKAAAEKAQSEKDRFEAERMTAFAKTFEDQAPEDIKAVFRKYESHPENLRSEHGLIKSLLDSVVNKHILDWSTAQTIFILERLAQPEFESLKNLHETSKQSDRPFHKAMRFYGVSEKIIQEETSTYTLDLAIEAITKMTETPDLSKDKDLIEYLRYRSGQITKTYRKKYESKPHILKALEYTFERAILEPRGPADLKAERERKEQKIVEEKDQPSLEMYNKNSEEFLTQMSDPVRMIFELPMESELRAQSIQNLIQQKYTFTTGDALFIFLNLPPTRLKSHSVLAMLLNIYQKKHIRIDDANYSYVIRLYMLHNMSQPIPIETLQGFYYQIRNLLDDLAIGSSWRNEMMQLLDHISTNRKVKDAQGNVLNFQIPEVESTYRLRSPKDVQF